MQYHDMTKVIDGKKYSTVGLKPIASNDGCDGSNYEREGTNCFLFRTEKGAYFFQHLSQWANEPYCWLEACTVDEAIEFWQDCDRHDEASEWETAFPNVKIEDA